MPSPSSHGSNSHSSRSTGEEPKRRKRYSLRIEFLDDDEDFELDGSRDTIHRQKRSDRGASSSRGTSNGQPEHSRETRRRPRRASVCSTAAVIGSGNRSDPPLTSTPPSSDRGRREGTRLDASHTSQRKGNNLPTIEQLSQDFSRKMSVQDRSETDLPDRFQRQMSLRDHDPIAERSTSHNRRSKKPSRKSAYTQTDIWGVGMFSTPDPFRRPSTSSTPYPGPFPLNQDYLNIESVYLEGFHAGKRQAAAQHAHLSPIVPPAPAPAPARSTTTTWPEIQPPQPMRCRPRAPERTTPSPAPPSARDQPRAKRSGAQQREPQEQPRQQQQRWYQNLLSRGAREPSPPPSRSGSRLV
ncbi:hypothetical protein F4781DRAFT_436127 [Annulohypoxylon bovei var. microspora]|nr:hypothetical protein F4781DRAFT_436127 [Annulohypoxylon bovei var. microspora]